MLWKTLLVPHDFSPAAAGALALARDLAAAFGGKIALLHVSPIPHGLRPDSKIVPEDGSATIRIDEYMTAAAARKLEALCTDSRVPMSIHTVAAEREAAGEILAKAKEVGADVIVMGTHGRSGMKRLLVGSVAESVLRRATVPVVVVRDPTETADSHLREEDAVRDEESG